MRKLSFILIIWFLVLKTFAQSTQMYPDSVVIYTKTEGTALKVVTLSDETEPPVVIQGNSEVSLGPLVDIRNEENHNSTGALSVANYNDFGYGGLFYIKNNTNANTALEAFTLGSGSAFSAFNGGTGSAGIFEIDNTTNSADALSIKTNGLGTAANFAVKNSSNPSKGLKLVHQGLGAAAFFQVLNISSNANAVETQTNGSGAGIYSFNSGTGKAGHFQISNGSNNQNSIFATSNGSGETIYSTNTGAGSAGHFRNTNTTNANIVLQSHNSGLGTSGFFSIFNTSNTAPAIETRTNGSGRSIYALNEGTGQAGNFEISGLTNSSTTLYSKTKGTGRAAEIIVDNTTNNKEALYINHKGQGDALLVEHTGGDGYTAQFIGNQYNSNATVYTSSQNGGAALLAVAADGGEAALFGSYNSVKEAVYMETDGSASVLRVNHIGQEGLFPNFDGDIAVFQDFGLNKIRLDRDGKGYFNGGTQNSGADIAESFEVEGNKQEYEPGDVLVISTKTDRTIEKSSEAYSSLVAGVYATKPGVLLTENHIDSDLSAEVPMGVVGVIPTKVCNEGGPIQRGDLLVSSSKTGFAMKADIEKVKIGQVLGKALENFEGESGKIKVLVNVK